MNSKEWTEAKKEVAQDILKKHNKKFTYSKPAFVNV